MPDLDHNISSELKKLAQERKEKQEALQQTLVAQTAPVVDTNTSSSATPPEPPKPEAVLPVEGNPPVAAPEEPKPEVPLTSTPVEEPTKPWDADDSAAVTATVESKFDAKKLGSALGLEVNDET